MLFELIVLERLRVIPDGVIVGVDPEVELETPELINSSCRLPKELLGKGYMVIRHKDLQKNHIYKAAVHIMEKI